MKKGFTYIYTKEKYEAYKKVPAWQKLEWLEKMNRFLFNFMPPKSKELWGKLRRGEI
jgi:predicted phosphoadenosine phosphosulfate sulfurtransferase